MTTSLFRKGNLRQGHKAMGKATDCEIGFWFSSSSSQGDSQPRLPGSRIRFYQQRRHVWYCVHGDTRHCTPLQNRKVPGGIGLEEQMEVVWESLGRGDQGIKGWSKGVQLGWARTTLEKVPLTLCKTAFPSSTLAAAKLSLCMSIIGLILLLRFVLIGAIRSLLASARWTGWVPLAIFGLAPASIQHTFTRLNKNLWRAPTGQPKSGPGSCALKQVWR